MAKDKKVAGRKLALTILVGVFIAIMVATLANLIVSYAYESPQYEDYCDYGYLNEGPYAKPLPGVSNCTYNQAVNDQAQQCFSEKGNPIYEYDSNGCATRVKECNMCQKDFEDATKIYNRNSFFIFAALGFILVVIGLFIGDLLIQIITLPSGAFLVIEAAVRNFDDKLYVIITFALLIIAATYLAWRKLR